MIETKKQTNRALVAWSGGVDSTALISRYLNEGWGVDALPVIVENNPNKMAREQRAREEAMRYFAPYNVTLLQPTKVHVGAWGDIQMMQTPIWLWALASSVNEQHAEVAIGYVMEDDAISFIDEMKALWAAYSEFLGTHPPLVFPLSKVHKRTLYNDLPYGLKTAVTWCEGELADNDRCGVCSPCKRMIFLDLQKPKEPETSAASQVRRLRKRISDHEKPIFRSGRF